MMIDSHCHPHIGAGGRHSARAVVASTHAGDWEAVRAYAGPVAARAYGVHPWWAETAQGDWLARLRAHLQAEPEALCGELGLDGLRGGGPHGALDAARQDDVFRAQLALASQLRRPCTVHCVRAYGRLREALDEAPSLPPALAMHSYGGSFDFARDLKASLERRGSACFFGFSWIVNGRRKPEKQADVIKCLDGDSILLETDLEEGTDIDDNLARAATLVADARGWTADDAHRRCDENARLFLLSGRV
ncbi:hypothetical protein CTAYLR_006945 [Chrysophaeum taylorii]|uniref:Uncharacterized protein n=1 Tax=Chrysophaeum taylorii TaxID=2483200 RepID=A0AAD7XPA6_9STRA|nr:hypothetical protein CTAYLR_006945 [Chrysophaeum taylorii]